LSGLTAGRSPDVHRASISVHGSDSAVERVEQMDRVLATEISGAGCRAIRSMTRRFTDGDSNESPAAATVWRAPISSSGLVRCTEAAPPPFDTIESALAALVEPKTLKVVTDALARDVQERAIRAAHRGVFIGLRSGVFIGVRRRHKS
jgi:hypothetical protein